MTINSGSRDRQYHLYRVAEAVRNDHCLMGTSFLGEEGSSGCIYCFQWLCIIKARKVAVFPFEDSEVGTTKRGRKGISPGSFPTFRIWVARCPRKIVSSEERGSWTHLTESFFQLFVEVSVLEKLNRGKGSPAWILHPEAPQHKTTWQPWSVDLLLLLSHESALQSDKKVVPCCSYFSVMNLLNPRQAPPGHWEVSVIRWVQMNNLKGYLCAFLLSTLFLGEVIHAIGFYLLHMIHLEIYRYYS